MNNAQKIILKGKKLFLSNWKDLFFEVTLLNRLKSELFYFASYQFPSSPHPFFILDSEEKAVFNSGSAIYVMLQPQRTLIQIAIGMGAGQIFNLPRTDDFSRRGKVPSHLTAKVVSTVAFQNKIKNLSCTYRD